MSAPTTVADLPDRLPSGLSASISDGVTTPLRLHTPGPIPPVDDDDDDEDEDKKRGGTGGSIDPDDEDDEDDDVDDEDDDDEATSSGPAPRSCAATA